MSRRHRRHLAASLAAAVACATFAFTGSDVGAQPRTVSWLMAGDSFSSGHGTPGEYGQCRRNDDAWPKVAYASARIDATHAFVACSGNVMDDIYAQAGGRRYDLVTFSFGGNDIGFAAIVGVCVAGGTIDVADNPWLNGFAGCPPDSFVRGIIAEQIGNQYPNFLRRVATDVVSPGGNVVVVGYPALVEEPDRWTGVAQAIDLCNGIQRADAHLMRGWAGLLNAEIGSAVAAVNAERPNGVRFTFVNNQDGAGRDPRSPHVYEPEGSTARHNLCGTQPWVNGPSANIFTQVGFHPTLDGHRNTGLLVADVVRNLDWGGLAGGGPTPPPPDATGTTSAPAGQLIFSIDGTCTSSGGTLTASSGGFTPGGSYRVSAWRPDGSAYTDLFNSGSVRSDGSIVWRWPCAGDPAGTYTTEVVDNATGRSTGRVPFTIGGAQPTTTPTTAPRTTTTVPRTTTTAQPATFSEQSGSHGSPTFRNPANASGPGERIPAMSWVEVSCKVLPSPNIPSAYPDGWWYRIASAPWNNEYYAVANTFWNDDVPGQTPYTSNVDPDVPNC